MPTHTVHQKSGKIAEYVGFRPFLVQGFSNIDLEAGKITVGSIWAKISFNTLASSRHFLAILNILRVVKR